MDAEKVKDEAMRFEDSTLWMMARSRNAASISGFCRINGSCLPLLSMHAASNQLVPSGTEVSVSRGETRVTTVAYQ